MVLGIKERNDYPRWGTSEPPAYRGTNVIGGGNLDARLPPLHPEAEAPPHSCLLQRRPGGDRRTGLRAARAGLGRRGRSLSGRELLERHWSHLGCLGRLRLERRPSTVRD